VVSAESAVCGLSSVISNASNSWQPLDYLKGLLGENCGLVYCFYEEDERKRRMRRKRRKRRTGKRRRKSRRRWKI